MTGARPTRRSRWSRPRGRALRPEASCEEPDQVTYIRVISLIEEGR